ncbi:MAG: phytase, partial [Woeseiaceae bacterium]
MQYKNLLIVFSLFVAACQPEETVETGTEPEHSGVRSIQATSATTPTGADSANDSAIWINAEDPPASLILGADATGGLELYGLDGERVGAMS